MKKTILLLLILLFNITVHNNAVANENLNCCENRFSKTAQNAAELTNTQLNTQIESVFEKAAKKASALTNLYSCTKGSLYYNDENCSAAIRMAMDTKISKKEIVDTILTSIQSHIEINKLRLVANGTYESDISDLEKMKEWSTHEFLKSDDK